MQSLNFKPLISIKFWKGNDKFFWNLDSRNFNLWANICTSKFYICFVTQDRFPPIAEMPFFRPPLHRLSGIFYRFDRDFLLGQLNVVMFKAQNVAIVLKSCLVWWMAWHLTWCLICRLTGHLQDGWHDSWNVAIIKTRGMH